MARIAVQGEWGTVEWAMNLRRDMPARDYYLSLPDERKAKINALFRRLAEQGRIDNREKFKNLGQRAKGKGAELWEFKSFQDRFLGDFRPGRRFVVAYGLSKKSDKLPKADIEKAVRILDENDEMEKRVNYHD